MRIIAAAVLLLLVPAAAAAQAAAPAAAPVPTCAAMDRNLPAGLGGWAGRTPLTAAAVSADLPKAALKIGQGVDAKLPPTPQVKFELRPEKPGGTVSNGGMFSLDIGQAGTYQVVLSTGAWIDLVRDGKALVSTAHGHGPDCSTMRKLVSFPLQPGRHLIQISANAGPALAIMVARQN
jgi:hypothetical protein